MVITEIHYTDYRNLADCTVSFCDGMNVLYGRNAQGKSNILEGIYYFARGRSFRGAHDRELIRFSAPFTRLQLSFVRETHRYPTVLEAYLPRTGKKRFTKNGAPLSSVVEMFGNLRAVLFCPAHLSMITGGPLERRTFLDIALSQLSHEYLTCLRRYVKLLAERNALIKLADGGRSVTETEWAVYEEGLAATGAVIGGYRREYVAQLAESVRAYFDGLNAFGDPIGAEKPDIRYQSHSYAEDDPETAFLTGGTVDAPEEIRDRLRERLCANRVREIAAGTTLYGIHKDDVRLTLNDREAKLYASQGQQRSLVLALKLAEGEIAGKIGGEVPIFLLDDVFSELDERRRAFMLEMLTGRQIIVTSCEPEVIPERYRARHVAFHEVRDGTVDGQRVGANAAETIDPAADNAADEAAEAERAENDARSDRGEEPGGENGL